MRKKLGIMALVISFFVLSGTDVAYAELIQEETGWRYRLEDGTFAKGSAEAPAWVWTSETSCLAFDRNGFMIEEGITKDGYRVSGLDGWVPDTDTYFGLGLDDVGSIEEVRLESQGSAQWAKEVRVLTNTEDIRSIAQKFLYMKLTPQPEGRGWVGGESRVIFVFSGDKPSVTIVIGPKNHLVQRTFVSDEHGVTERIEKFYTSDYSCDFDGYWNQAKSAVMKPPV